MSGDIGYTKTTNAYSSGRHWLEKGRLGAGKVLGHSLHVDILIEISGSYRSTFCHASRSRAPYLMCSTAEEDRVALSSQRLRRQIDLKFLGKLEATCTSDVEVPKRRIESYA